MLSRISLLAAALLLAGCESGSNQQLTPSGAQPADATTTAVEPARPAETGQPEPAGNTVPQGELEIRILDTGVTITANAVSQQTILYQLATRAGFGITEAGVPWEVVTLAIEADTLHAALVALLKQHRYQIIYEFDTERQADTLARVVVGDLLTGQEGMPAAVDTGTTADTSGSGMLPGATEASPSVEEQDYLAQLLDASPEVREDAARRIEPVGIALDYLATIVTSDPSADVRIAAAETLEGSKDPRALEALILALQDEHPEVLAVVIEALEYMENRLAVPYLQPFLEHPDEDVRDAAEYALDQFN
jgi:hypothetical protein